MTSLAPQKFNKTIIEHQNINQLESTLDNGSQISDVTFSFKKSKIIINYSNTSKAYPIIAAMLSSVL
jgi:hypothetical protein